jgi:hypothetical protein
MSECAARDDLHEELTCFNHYGKKLLCSIEIANVLQERAREVVSFSLNCTEAVLRASLVLQNLFHAPTSSNAIVRASKLQRCTQTRIYKAEAV